MSQPTRPDDDRSKITEALSTLRIGRWSDIDDLMMVRLRPPPLASQLARPLARARNRSLVLDVGIAVGSGAIAPSVELLAGWRTAPDKIWRTALRNTLSELPLDVSAFAVQGLHLTVLSGGLFTSGLIVDPVAHLRRVGVEVTQERLWVSALNATTVVVTTIAGSFRPHSSPDANADLAETEATIVALHADLRASVLDRLPANLFGFRLADRGWVDVQGSFTSGRTLE